jgi:hydroxymethylglutaryl-CoA lyase
MSREVNPKIRIVEVGLRDGLQNEDKLLSTVQRFKILKGLLQSGLKNLEIGSFVSPKWVPQMAGTDKLFQLYNKNYLPVQRKRIAATALVPNEHGFQQALKNQVKEIAVFISSTESFSQRNINCSIAESLERVKKIISLARKNKIKVRGYLSVCFGCPYEGKVSEKKVIELATQLYKLGCYEVSIGDTIGIAHPIQVERLFKKLKAKIPVKALAGHFHDTKGLALVNIWTAYQVGITCFDSSIGGLGGCPYAEGASGNVATEDVVNLFHQSNISTGVDLKIIVQVSQFLEKIMNKKMNSKVAQTI